MTTPFDDFIGYIQQQRYHKHRGQEHSDIVSRGIFSDLLAMCETIREDYENGVVKEWYNIKTPGARGRKIDFLLGEPQGDGAPDLNKLRICIENKSVMTAHRNASARYDDLNESLQVLWSEKPEAVLVATVMIGTCEKFLNVPDTLKKFYGNRMNEFNNKILPRLSSGDQELFVEFEWAISTNRPTHPLKTRDKFRQLETRKTSHTHKEGYDYILLVPVLLDNVNPPELARVNDLGINIDEEYNAMIEHICKTYTARWHP